MKVRIQHPQVHERTDRGGSYWFFRYWDDVLQADGTTKAVRKFHVVGPSENRLAKKHAEVERDKFLAKINKTTVQEKVADGLALLSKMVENNYIQFPSALSAMPFVSLPTAEYRIFGPAGTR